MADQQNKPQFEPYVPDPAELRRAYWILFGIFILAALFIYAEIDTVMRHGNPFDIIMKASGGGAGGH